MRPLNEMSAAGTLDLWISKHELKAVLLELKELALIAQQKAAAAHTSLCDPPLKRDRKPQACMCP